MENGWKYRVLISLSNASMINSTEKVVMFNEEITK